MPTIGVCTSARESSIKGLLSELERIPDVKVKFTPLPYNDLKNYRLPADEIDGVILCHSIYNRRFAISDVMDALYNEFLRHAAATFGKSNIVVIAHDFQWPFKSHAQHSKHSQLKEEKMAQFRIQQPTVFKSSSLAMICGRLDEELEMDEEDWIQLETFATRVHKVKPISSASGGDKIRWMQDLDITPQLMIVVFLFFLAMYFLYKLVKRTMILVLSIITVVLVCLFSEQIFSFLWEKFANVLQKVRSFLHAFLANLSHGLKIVLAILAILILLLAIYSLKGLLIGIASFVIGSIILPLVLVYLFWRKLLPFLRQKLLDVLHKLRSFLANASTGVKFVVAIILFLLAMCLLNSFIKRIVFLIYNVTKTVISVCLILLPIVYFLWQKLNMSFKTQCHYWQKNVSRSSIQQWMNYAKGFLKSYN